MSLSQLSKRVKDFHSFVSPTTPTTQDIPVNVRSHLPRVLHTRLVHRREKANLSFLQRKGGSQANVSQPLGQAAFVVRQSVKLDPLFGRLATTHHHHRPGHQLESRIGVTSRLPRFERRIRIFLQRCTFFFLDKLSCRFTKFILIRSVSYRIVRR